MKWHFTMMIKKNKSLNLDDSDRRYKRGSDGQAKLTKVNNSTLPPHIPQTDMAEKKQGIKVNY